MLRFVITVPSIEVEEVELLVLDVELLDVELELVDLAPRCQEKRGSRGAKG